MLPTLEREYALGEVELRKGIGKREIYCKGVESLIGTRYKKRKERNLEGKSFFLPTLRGLHPLATCICDNLSNVTEGIFGNWLTE